MANTYSIDLEAGSSQYLSITDASQTGLDITGDMTLECWVRFETVPTDIRYLISKWLITGNQKSYILYQNGSTNQLVFINSPDGSSAPAGVWSWTPSVNTWYHVAITLDVSATTAEFYLNGVSQGTDATVGSSTYNSTAPFEIGAYNGTQTLDGLIDDVRVWNDIRTQEEISNNFNKELIGNETGLVGYWKLNNNANDSTSNGNNLTLNNSPVYSTTIPFVEDRSIDLEDSSAQYLSISDSDQTGLDITGDMTLEFWWKPEGLPDYEYFISKWNTSSNRSYLFIYDNIQNVFQFANSSTGANAVNSGTSFPYSPSSGTWYHVAMVYDASEGEASVYVDGNLIGTNSSMYTSIYNGTANFRIGSSDSSVQDIDGLMSDVRVWNTTRTQDQIQKYKNRKLNGNESGLVGYWQFNGNPNDTTSNNNHLTENNSPTYSTDVPFTESDGTKINTLNIESIGLINGITIGDVAIKNGFRL